MWENTTQIRKYSIKKSAPMCKLRGEKKKP